MSLQPHRAFVDETRETEAADPEEFDRVQYALDAVSALRGVRITVAVYRRNAGLRVDSVRDLRGGEGARWVMLGVPPRASRAQIAHALADVAGVARVPYVVDILVRAGRDVA